MYLNTKLYYWPLSNALFDGSKLLGSAHYIFRTDICIRLDLLLDCGIKKKDFPV